MSFLRKTLLLAAVLATVTGLALAAPNRTGSLAVGGSYNWDGGPITGAVATAEVGDTVPCGAPGKECDQTLLNVTSNGQLSVKTTSDDAGSTDLDLYLYASNANGDQGKFLKSSTGPDANENLSAEAVAGYYLVVVVPATATAGTYKGSASLAALPPEPGDVDYGKPPPPPPGGGGTTGGDGGASGGASAPPAAPNLAPATKASAPKARPVRSLNGTAADPDGTIAYVDVALVRGTGKNCRRLSAKGTFVTLHKCTAPAFLRAKGTTTWRLALRRPLAKGTYVLYARATDVEGRPDGGFGAANRLTFRVR